MALIQQLSKSLVSQYALSSVTQQNLSAITLFLDHAPQNIDYPIITYKVISAPRSWAMSNHKYINARVQFTVFVNENEYEQGMTIANELENIYDLVNLGNIGNSVTHICTKIVDESISFFNQQEKIWQINQDYRFRVGS